MQPQIILPSGLSFTPKRLTLRALKEAVVVVEAIRESKKQSATLELIEKALELTIENSETLFDSIDIREAMQLIGEAISGGRVNDDERKKSE